MAFWSLCPHFVLWCVIVQCASTLDVASGGPNRTARYGYAGYSESRLPYNPAYHSRPHYDSGYKPYYSHGSDYNTGVPVVPTGFDQSVPSSNLDRPSEKYNYEVGGFYIPLPDKDVGQKLPDFVIEEVTETTKKELEKVLLDKHPPPKVQDNAIKTLKTIGDSQNGNTQNAADALVSAPTFLSVIANLFTNPLVIMSLIGPITMALVALFEPLLRYFIGSDVIPSVITTMASRFARNFENDARVDLVLKALGDFGVTAIEDPRCLQRSLCFAAKYQIESRTFGSWSIQKLIHSFRRFVSERLLDLLGLRKLFSSIETGNCGTLICNGNTMNMKNLSLFDKLRLLSAKVFNYTLMI